MANEYNNDRSIIGDAIRLQYLFLSSLNIKTIVSIVSIMIRADRFSLV